MGLKAVDMLDQNLSDFVIEEEKQYFKSSLSECTILINSINNILKCLGISKESFNFLIHLKSSEQDKTQFSVSLNSISVNNKLLFIISKFELYK